MMLVGMIAFLIQNRVMGVYFVFIPSMLGFPDYHPFSVLLVI